MVKANTPRKYLAAFGLSVLMLIAGGCREAADQPEQPLASTAAIPLQPDANASWIARDTDGKVRSVQDFSGSVLAVYFGFTHCPAACPTAMAKLKAVRRGLEDYAEGFHAVLISVDPERDTSERLADYVRTFDASFIGLRPEADDLARVKSVFRVYAQKSGSIDSYTVDHSELIYIIGCDGIPRWGVKPEANPAEIVSLLTPLLEERACAT